MPQTRLTLTVPEHVWIGDISRDFPSARFRILSAFSDGTSGFGLVEIHHENPETLLSAVAAREQVTDLTELKRGDTRTVVQFETSDPLLLLPVQDSGVPLEMPFDLQNGTASWELTAPTERLSALGDRLEAFGIPFSVEYVRQGFETEQLLTDTQRERLATAIEMGYYDTPRGCSLTDVASALDIAKSTASETLHRAEERIIKKYAEDLDPPLE
ncbi:MAG: helix-turn-helix domain-containing protein [Halovenus sp.]